MQINLDNIIKGYTGRLIILFGICLLGSFILVWRLWDVQIKNGPEYTKEVANQSIRKIRVSPVRGRISTSDNVIIADTEPQYNIVLHFSEMRQSGRNSRKKTITYILNLLEEIAENIGRINTVTKKKIQRHIYQYTAIPFNAFKDLTPRELARISEKMPKYKGLEIQIKYIRTYPLKKFFAHTLGFTGRRKPSQENLEEKRKAFYVFHEPSGRCGLEKTYDKTLRGKPGIHMVRIDISSYAHNKLPGGIPVENGNELILTINSKFQRAAEKVLIGKTGSIVIVNCNSGEILAMASSPTYDLSKLTAKEYQGIIFDILL
ncbi:MAG: hypothetical protein U9O87_08625, partial [Verrucomicrobiota bacterium]|nr:hypothetical protein [Verrucomicrobiota bacterium]